MIEFKDVTPVMIEEMRALPPEGDLDLSKDYKQPFKRMFGRETTLTDEQLLHVAATMDDDYGSEANAKQVAAGEVYFDTHKGGLPPMQEQSPPSYERFPPKDQR